MTFKDLMKDVYDSANDYAIKKQNEYYEYCKRYSRMNSDQLKKEYHLKKSDIARNPMRKKAFREACEDKGLIKNK